MKTVLITGTSSGFGRLAAELMAAKGHRVYATMIDPDGADKCAAQGLAAKTGIRVVGLELSDTASVNAAVAQAINETGKLDVLINNAWYFTMGIAESFTEADLQRMYNINVIGPWRAIRAAMPQFREQRDGLIITVTSSLARFSSPFMTIYSSAKHALEGLLEGMRYEIKPFGVEHCFIEPGVFPTQVFNNALSGSDEAINKEYGPFATITDQIRSNLNTLFKSGHAADPILVPHAMLRLIDMPKGTRPLRTVVDPAASAFTERANAAVAVEFENFLRASGMGSLLD